MIVALEGIDGCGKSTLARALGQELKDKGLSVGLFQFSKEAPILATFAQEMISQGLTGKYYALHSIFAAARLARLPYFLHPEHDVILVDRYKYSSQVYGVCQGLSEDWCLAVEAPLPEACMVLLLDLPVEVAQRRKQVPDVLDSNAELQHAVRTRYLERARGRANWLVVDATAPREDVLNAALRGVLSGFGTSRA